MNLKPHEISLFKVVIKDLLISVKNGTLYDFNHPIYLLAIEKLKDSIEEWFKVQKSFILGFSANRILMNSELIESKEEFFREMARLLHAKGILSVEFNKKITTQELAEFVCHLKVETYNGPDALDGTEKWSSKYPNIQIKELDYRLLLTSKSTEYTTEEEEIWAQLFRLDLSLADGLPESKMELLLNFFKAPSESASFLNRIYREAINKESDENVVNTFQQAIFNICEYFRGKPNQEERKSFKINLARIVSRLHPDLVEQLFQSTVIQGKNFDMARELIDDFSDQNIAEFIESLIQQNGSVNEYLIKIFQKMLPSEQSAMNVMPMVTDHLFAKHVLNPQNISKIQLSIKELFKNHPQNHFLNEMYKITVDAISDAGQHTLKYSVRLGPVVNQFVKDYEDEFFIAERTWILAKTLIVETNYLEYHKIGEKLVTLVKELLNKRKMLIFKNLLAYMIQNQMDSQKMERTPLDKEKNYLFHKIVDDDNLKGIIQMIPEASDDQLPNILYTMVLLKTLTTPLLLDMYLSVNRPAIREKLMKIFSEMKDTVNIEVVSRIDPAKPNEVRELFKILQMCDPEKLNTAARKMIFQKNATLLWDGLDHFIPRTSEDLQQMFKLAFHHSNSEIKRKAILAVLQSRNNVFIEDLFKKTQGTFRSGNQLNSLVKLSGQVKSEMVFAQLSKVFLKGRKFFANLNDTIKLNALNSMCIINSNKALELVKSSKLEKGSPFAKKCESVLKKHLKM